MNVLETILSFLTTLARIIFPRRKRPVAGDDLVLVLCLSLLSLLSLWRGETEVTLAALGAILPSSLPRPPEDPPTPKPTGSVSPATP